MKKNILFLLIVVLGLVSGDVFGMSRRSKHYNCRDVNNNDLVGSQKETIQKKAQKKRTKKSSHKSGYFTKKNAIILAVVVCAVAPMAYKFYDLLYGKMHYSAENDPQLVPVSQYQASIDKTYEDLSQKRSAQIIHELTREYLCARIPSIFSGFYPGC